MYVNPTMEANGPVAVKSINKRILKKKNRKCLNNNCIGYFKNTISRIFNEYKSN